MRYRYTVPKYREAWNGEEDRLARGLTATMGEVTQGLKADLRAQVAGAGLGTRLANTWQGKTFPTGRPSLDPSAYLWSKAPQIILAFSQGATIVPVNGSRRLAIPTKNVPRKGRGLMSPVEVEAEFNQDLTILPGRNGALLAFVNVAGSFRSRGFRPGRVKKLVLMFVLVRSVRLAKRFDITEPANRWAGQVQSLLNDKLR